MSLDRCGRGTLFGEIAYPRLYVGMRDLGERNPSPPGLDVLAQQTRVPLTSARLEMSLCGLPFLGEFPHRDGGAPRIYIAARQLGRLGCGQISLGVDLAIEHLRDRAARSSATVTLL